MGGDPFSMMGSAPPGGMLNSVLGGGNTPYAHGYGMGSPGPFQGYQSSVGLQAPMGYGDPSQGGGDLTQRGIGENFFGSTGGAYANPAMSEFYAANALNKYSSGTPRGSTKQTENYGRFSAERPDISAEPGLGAYYDRAVDRATTDINNQLAARGVYGSSGGLGRIQDAVTDLRADQAKNEAQYNLQRLGEQRNWEGLQGQLAGAADQNSLNNSGNDLSWLTGLGGLSSQADRFGLGRLAQGQQAANWTQDAEQNRFQTLLGNEMGMGGAMSGLMGNAYGDMLNNDYQMLQDSMGMGMGLASEALNQDYRTQEKIKDDSEWAMDMMGGVMGGMLGGL